jgi:flagellin-specific chaperone FliS
MANIAGYGKYQSISLEGEAAYEELYTRLARWTREADAFQHEGKVTEAEAKLDRCIEILGYMDRGIDMSKSRDVALAILSLHRFAIAALVKAKGERATADLEPLVKIFLSLADIFAAIRASRSNASA